MPIRPLTRTEMIAQQVRSARERAGLSQEDVATRLGLTRPTYGHYERGRTPFQIDTLFVLADLLNLRVAALLGLDEGLAADESLLIAAYRKLNGSPHQARVLVAFLELCRVWTSEATSPVAGDPALLQLFVARQDAASDLTVGKPGVLQQPPAPAEAAAASEEAELLGYLQELGSQGRALIRKLLDRLPGA